MPNPKSGTGIYTYECWQDFVSFCINEEHNPLPINKSAGRADFGYSGKEWYGGATWAETKDYARNGWHAGFDKVKKVSEKIHNTIDATVIKDGWFQDITGLFADPGLVAEGIPECCYDIKPTKGSGPAVKIVINGCVSAGVSDTAIVNRGAAVCAVVEALEVLGRQSEVWLGINSVGYDIQVCIKRADSPLQMDQLTFALAHPAVLRRLAFCHFEINKMPQATNYDGYGRVMDSDIKDGNIVLKSAYLHDRDWGTTEAAAKSVTKWLKDLGYIREEETV